MSIKTDGGEGASRSNLQGASPKLATNNPGNGPGALGGKFGGDFLGQKLQEMYTLFEKTCREVEVIKGHLPRDEASLVSDVLKNAEIVVDLAFNGNLRSVTIVVSGESKDSIADMQQARAALDPRIELMETLNVELHTLTQVILATAPGYGNPVGEIVGRVVKKACNSSNDVCDEVLDYLMQNGIDIHVAEVYLCDLSEKDMGLFSTRGSDVI